MVSNRALRKRDSLAARNIGSTRFQSNITEFSEILNQVLFFNLKSYQKRLAHKLVLHMLQNVGL